MSRARRVLPVLLAVALGAGTVGTVASSAQAAAATIDFAGTYSLDSAVGVDYAPDGTLWATDFYGDRAVHLAADKTVVSSIDLEGWARGIAVDSKGDVWTATDSGIVRKYSSSGDLLVTLPETRNTFFNAMTVDGDDNLLLRSSNADAIEVRSPDGVLVRTFATGLGNVSGIEVAPDGDVFAMTSNGSVRRFSAAGALENSFSVSVVGATTFGMDVDAKNALWVSGRGEVVKLSLDGSVLARFGSYGSGSGQFNTAIDVATSRYGRIAVSDYQNNRIQEFTTGPAFSDFTPAISGSGTVGEELSVAEPTGVSPTPSSFGYAWTVSGSDTVRSDAKTFTPTAADLGKTVKVSVTAKGDGSEDAPADRTYTASTTVLPQQFSDFSPSISGSGVVGDELTVDAGDISPEPTSTTFAWTVEGSDTARSTTDAFTPAAADKGKKVTVTVTATGEDGNPETRSESTSIDVKGKAYGDFTPTYTGSPVVGGTVTAEDPAGLGEGTTVVSQWQTRGDGDEDWTDVGEDGVFSPQVADLDKSLRLVQTLSSDDHEDKTSQSAITTIGKGTLTAAKPTISGTAKVGETLTASVGELPDGVSVSSWAWGIEGSEGCVVDPDLDGSSQEVLSSWAGEKVCVVATISADGYDDSTSTSDGVGPVVKGDAPLLGFAPTISDTTPRVGEELTASLPLARGAESSKGFEWGTRAKDGTCDASIKGTTYTPTVEDLGKDLCVVYTVRDVQGYEDGVSTAAFTSRVREDRKAFVNDRTVRKGQKITISATDLVPGKPYVFRVYGKELTGTAPANGRVSRTWTYPKDAKTKTRKIAVIQRAKPKALYYEVVTLRYTR